MIVVAYNFYNVIVILGLFRGYFGLFRGIVAPFPDSVVGLREEAKGKEWSKRQRKKGREREAVTDLSRE